MWLDYKQYQAHEKIPLLLKTMQEELVEFLKVKQPTDVADLTWFEKRYGHLMGDRDIVKLWYVNPSIRDGEITEWADNFPKTSKLAMELPGIVNFSLNVVSPGGQCPPHTDYRFDMNPTQTKAKRAYVILLGIDIPSTDINVCGFDLNGDKKLLVNGDIISFDGAFIHSSWNYSDKYRYTVNIDFAEDCWNL